MYFSHHYDIAVRFRLKRWPTAQSFLRFSHRSFIQNITVLSSLQFFYLCPFSHPSFLPCAMTCSTACYLSLHVAIGLVIHVWRFICSIYHTCFGNKMDKIRYLLLLMLAFSFGDSLISGMAVWHIIPTCNSSIPQIWSRHRCISLRDCSSTSSKNSFGAHHCWGIFLYRAFCVG